MLIGVGVVRELLSILDKMYSQCGFDFTKRKAEVKISINILIRQSGIQFSNFKCSKGIVLAIFKNENRGLIKL